MTRIDSPLPLVNTGAAGAGQAGRAAGPVTTVTLSDSPPNLARMTAGSIIAGVVIGRNQKGQTQIRTDHGMLSFRTQIALPTGAQLILQIQPTGSQIQVAILSITLPGPDGATGNAGPGAQPAGGDASVPVEAGPGAAGSFHLHELARQWPALAEALAALQIGGGPAGQLLQALVARPDAQIAPTLLFFMAALTNSDIRDWLKNELGRALSAAGRRDLVASLSSDLSELSRLANPSDDAEWRAFLLPLDDGERISQIRFFLKRQRSAVPAGDDQPATRFIFEVDLSRLGSLQFDGLAGGSRFDLMVRSHAPLPRDVQARISAIFTAARDEGRLSGDVGFQTVAKFAISPLESALDRDAGVVA